jgi:hypothetical protein
MDNARIRYFALLISVIVATSVFAQKEFTQISPDVVIGSKELADELRTLSWQQAHDTWVPSEAQVLEGLNHLHTKEGIAEIATSAIAGIVMTPSLRFISVSRYQVFGLVFKDRMQILYDASPQKSSSENNENDSWLKQTLSVRVQDGGPVYWWALYDVQSHRFVASNRPP